MNEDTYHAIRRFIMANFETRGWLETTMQVFERWPGEHEAIDRAIDDVEAIVGVMVRDKLRDIEPKGSA